MKIEKRWYWLVQIGAFEHIGESAVLDVLRYDRAVVESNPPDGFYLFSSDAERLPRGPNEARLASFGIKPTWVSSQPVSYDYATSQAHEIAHQVKATLAKRRAAADGGA